MAAALRQNTALTKLTVGIPGMLESSMTTADLTGMLGAKEKEGYEGAMLLAAFLPRLKVLRTLTVSKFALPIQELRTATAVDLSGKELCGLDAIFIAGLIPGNRYYPRPCEQLQLCLTRTAFVHSTLQRLSLSGNLLGRKRTDEDSAIVAAYEYMHGLRALSDALKTNQ